MAPEKWTGEQVMARELTLGSGEWIDEFTRYSFCGGFPATNFSHSSGDSSSGFWFRLQCFRV